MRVLLLLLLSATTLHAQWQIQDSHSTASFRGIHSLGKGVAWASGTQGTVLRTIDDGKNWHACAVPPDAEKLDFRGIQAFDAKMAIVMSSGKGDLSRLYKTVDGCRSWKLVFSNPDKDGFWDAIQFYRGGITAPDPNRLNGMLVGDPVDGNFAIFVTGDSGETWLRWGNDPTTKRVEANVGESLFAASNSSIVSPGINGQYCFITGGKGGARLMFEQGHSPFDVSSWRAFSSSKIPVLSNKSAGAFSIARRAETDAFIGRFVIVGGDYLKPSIGSAAFAYQPTLFRHIAIKSAQTPPHGYRSSVVYDSTSRSWITVGPNGTDVSFDDGKNWRALWPSSKDGEAEDEDRDWNALSLPFVVGPKGRIGRLRAGAIKP
jgi:hypothetical protein